MNKTIVLDKRPVGKPELSDFRFIEEEKPSLKEGQLLLKLKFVSVDPYLRGRMSDAKSYVEPFKLGEPVASGCIAEVMESKNESFKKGDFVSGLLKWKEFQVSDGKQLLKIDDSELPLSAHLGVLGMTGLRSEERRVGKEW